MKTLLTALSALALAAPARPTPSPLPVAWTVSAPRAAGEQPRVVFALGRGNATGVTLEAAIDFQSLRQALGRGRGPVTFVLDREPGDLACTGTIAAVGRAEGRCLFTADPAFARGMAARGLPLRGREKELVGLAILGARLGLVDALKAEGAYPADADELVAALALGVTPAYVRQLRQAGMRTTSFDDLIACRALSVDGAYVRALASAGYPLVSSHDLIAMKAVGVTPAYARAMNASVDRP